MYFIIYRGQSDLLFVADSLTTWTLDSKRAARFRSLKRAREAALLTAVRRPNWIGKLEVQKRIGRLRIPLEA